MWPFKRKIIPKPETEEKSKIPMDCVFNSIIADLDNVEGWNYEFGKHSFEYYTNLKKGYILTCYNNDETGWLSDVSSDQFTPLQQGKIYRKCQEIYELRRRKKGAEKKAKDEKILKSFFPQCFK